MFGFIFCSIHGIVLARTLSSVCSSAISKGSNLKSRLVLSNEIISAIEHGVLSSRSTFATELSSTLLMVVVVVHLLLD